MKYIFLNFLLLCKVDKKMEIKEYISSSKVLNHDVWRKKMRSQVQ